MSIDTSIELCTDVCTVCRDMYSFRNKVLPAFWQFGHFLDLSIPAAKMVLLTLDTLKYDSIVVRRIFIRPEIGSSRKQRLL